MPETATASGPEPVAQPTSQVDTNPTPVAESTPAAEPAGIDALPDWAQQEIKKLRSENADRRTKLNTFEQAEADRKAASLSDLEKAQQAASVAADRASALEQKMAQRDALAAFRDAKVVDPELAYLAIKDHIKIKDGEPQNIADLVAEFVKARPAMVAQVAPIAPETRSTNPSSTPAPSSKGRPAGRL